MVDNFVPTLLFLLSTNTRERWNMLCWRPSFGHMLQSPVVPGYPMTWQCLNPSYVFVATWDILVLF